MKIDLCARASRENEMVGIKKRENIKKENERKIALEHWAPKPFNIF